MKNKNLKVVNGNGNELNISPVYDHIKMNSTQKRNSNKKENIVVPKSKKKK